jgi:hypothetical protein
VGEGPMTQRDLEILAAARHWISGR